MSPEAMVDTRKPSRAPGRSGIITAALWAAGIGLQFAAPLLRDRVPLSDELLIDSMIDPLWVFLQICVLSGVLTALRHPTDRLGDSGRVALALGAAIAVAFLEPNLLTFVLGSGGPLSADPVSAALLWSTPLAFYLVPAGIVVASWSGRGRRFSSARALGLAFVFIGVVNFPFILWLTHLWDVYIRTSGGGNVTALVSSVVMRLSV